MKINEIKLTRLMKTHDEESIISYAQQHGWELLGSGMEALVFEHPKKAYVLKLFNYKSVYKWFVELCQHHPNPHFPKFSRYVKPVGSYKQWNYVRMEKLAPISSFDDYPAEILSLWIKTTEQNISLSESVEDWIAERFELSHSWKDTEQAEIELAKLGGVDASWNQAVDLLLTWAQKKKIPHIDLHENNFMLRGNVLVIADPFFGDGDSY